MDKTVYLSTNFFMTLVVVVAPIMTLFFAGMMRLKSRVFRPGPQYLSTISNLKQKKKTVNKDKTEKEIAKQQKLRVAEENFNLTSRRCGLGITFEENNRKRYSLMVPALIITFMLLAIGLGVMGISMLIASVFFVLAFIAPFILLFGTEIKIMTLKTALHNDMIKDISRLVSMYKYSDSKRGIYGTIVDFINDSTALKADLTMFLADLNSFELNDALDRMAARVPVTQMANFISYVKSSSYMTNEQVVYSVMTLDNDLKTQVKDIMEKEVKRKFKTSMLVIVVCFAAVLMIYTAPTIVGINFEGIF